MTARHASTEVTPFRIPTLYLTPDTRDYPLVLLVEDYSGLTDSGLPCAYGVVLLRDARYPALSARALADVGGDLCEGCSEAVPPEAGCAVENTLSGGGNPAYLSPWHLSCLLAGDHYGVVPTSAVEFIGVE